MSRLSQIYPSHGLSVPAGDALGGAAPVVIGFRVQKQVMSQWCWAAVTSSIVGYLDPANAATWTQCAVASSELGRGCCNFPDSCDFPNVLDGPLNRVGRLRQPVINGYLRPAAVATELQADLPLPLRVGWRSGGGHFLAVFGIRQLNGAVELALTDPIFGESTIVGNALIAGGYQAAGGSWTHSYVVRR